MQTRSYQNIKDAIEDNWILKVGSVLLFLGSVVALAAVSIINLKPYVEFMGGIPVGWLFQIPAIGAAFRAMAEVVLYFAAVLIWAPVQFMQILWFLVLRDTKARKNAMRQSIRIATDLESEANKSARPEQFRGQIRSASKIPFQFIKWAVFFALGAYTFDLVVGLSVYPVFKDWQSFELYMKSFNPMWVNGANFKDLFVMLFAFEALFILTVISWDWLQLRKSS